MIVIGADIHKRNHTLVAVDGQTGAARGQLAIAASDAGALEALRFAVELVIPPIMLLVMAPVRAMTRGSPNRRGGALRPSTTDGRATRSKAGLARTQP